MRPDRYYTLQKTRNATPGPNTNQIPRFETDLKFEMCELWLAPWKHLKVRTLSLLGYNHFRSTHIISKHRKSADQFLQIFIPKGGGTQPRPWPPGTAFVGTFVAYRFRPTTSMWSWAPIIILWWTFGFCSTAESQSGVKRRNGSGKSHTKLRK